MAAMTAKKPLDFSSFPSVLLFATLLRLALNVASTRIVLLNGHEGGAAGKVIEAFGAFLIGGNFAVGIFVFLILMIINLMVVTKGAGRVSEVSARFTLDAMPGKQMAIDADLAAGLLTADEAKARRREIATEADFYGSMDGASKFVKGDAVAALLILLVNIIAGLVLGMSTHGLSAGEAAEFYVTLAVGDALVASVPALLLSIAAAVIVTRVSDARDLTGQISGQLADPKIWLPVACILLVIGCIPAMPQSIILPLSGGAFWLWHNLRKRQEAVDNAPEPVITPDPAHIGIDEVTDQTLVTIQLGYGLIHLTDEKHGATLVNRLTGLRKQMCQSFGFIVPQFRIEDSFEVEPDSYRITLGGAAIGGGKIKPHHLLAIDTGEVMHSQPVQGEATVDPSFGCPALWIEPGSRDLAVAEGCLAVDPESVIATQIPNCSPPGAGSARPGPGPRPDRPPARPPRTNDRDDHAAAAHACRGHTPAQGLLPTASPCAIRYASSPACRLRHSNRRTRSADRYRPRGPRRDDRGEAARPMPSCGHHLAAQLEEMVVGGLQDPASERS